MNHIDLVGQIFLEMELYELIRFDIEANHDAYFGKHMHIYFDRIPDQKICIVEVRFFEDHKVFNEVGLKSVTKRGWIEISQVKRKINLALCRLDRSGYITLIWKDRTHHEPWYHTWIAELPPHPPLTEEEIRLSFMQLAGILIDEASKRLTKLKIAM